MSKSINITHAEWLAEGAARFGSDPKKWRFVCPSCHHVASAQDWKDAGAPAGAVAFSCVGRYLGADGSNAFKMAGGPCNYAGGGLFGLNPIHIQFEDEDPAHAFAFADADEQVEVAT